MPTNDADTDAAVAREDGLTSQARAGGVAGMIPTAREPLKPAAINALGQLVTRLVPTLSGGQAPPIQLARVSGPVDRVPADLGVQIVTIAQFLEHAAGKVPGLDAYAFDPVESMSSNDGLLELQGVLDGLASDKQVIGALSQPAPPTVDPEPDANDPAEAAEPEA